LLPLLLLLVNLYSLSLNPNESDSLVLAVVQIEGREASTGRVSWSDLSWFSYELEVLELGVILLGVLFETGDSRIDVSSL
jgi:hypothetical protein